MERLWSRAMRDAVPLSKRKNKAVDSQKSGDLEKSSSEPPKKTDRSSRVAPLPPKTLAAPKPGPPSLVPGATAGVDRRTANRFLRGQMAIEARLDLHGHTAAAAHRALGGFIAGSQAAGRRCVLVITGKGARGEGVIRASLPAWLNEPPLRDLVLSIAPARPEHGGAGAFYVLLKRKRAS